MGKVREPSDTFYDFWGSLGLLGLPSESAADVSSSSCSSLDYVCFDLTEEKYITRKGHDHAQMRSDGLTDGMEDIIAMGEF